MTSTTINKFEICNKDIILFLRNINHIAEPVDHIDNFYAININKKQDKCIFIQGKNIIYDYKDRTTNLIYSVEFISEKNGNDQLYLADLDINERFMYLFIYSKNSIDCSKEFITKVLKYDPNLSQNQIHLFNNFDGCWSRKETALTVQTISQIYLNEEIKESILKRIDYFVNSKERYNKFGKSYKYNMLFTGVPGAGKTSLSKALALKYKRKLYSINLSKSLTDEDFTSLVLSVDPNSILLLEDIDSFFIDRQSTSDINISFSCLLNVLDGALSNINGLIIILTINHPDRVDPALLRPGRIDTIIKFDYPTKNEIRMAFFDLVDNPTEESFKSFYSNIKSLKINMSGIVDYLFRNPTDYVEKVNELIEQTELLKEIINDKIDKMYT
jgi:hypothetical protein